MNFKRMGYVVFFVFGVFLPVSVSAQQTLGWIEGTVTDSSGGVLQNVLGRGVV
jgi:uncharacterized membrane protein YeiH